MLKKIFVAALLTLAALAFSAPAFAQDYGMGNIMGTGTGGCGCGVTYGAPQDCVATVSCNIPATQMVPVPTTTTQMQTVSYPVSVPQQSSITVPKMVCVPQQVPITTYTTACAQTQVPVQVPATAYQPCTTMIPQTRTFALGCSTGSSCGCNMPSTCSTCGAGAAYSISK